MKLDGQMWTEVYDITEAGEIEMGSVMEMRHVYMCWTCIHDRKLKEGVR